MELFDSHPEEVNQAVMTSDSLQCEIAEQLDSGEPVDDLHLAALLGKTLLKKNEDLEMTLRRLQEFAEETLASNQTLTRQLGETKHSLQLTSQLCEQLELKVDELEKSNKDVTKVCEDRQVLLDQKSTDLAEMERTLNHMREECLKMQTDVTRLRKDKQQGEQDLRTFQRSKSEAARTRDDEMAQLRRKLEEVTGKLQDAASHRQRLKSELEEALGENDKLSKNLERTEGDLADLQLKFEELCENSRIGSSCSSIQQELGMLRSPLMSASSSSVGAVFFTPLSPPAGVAAAAIATPTTTTATFNTLSNGHFANFTSLPQHMLSLRGAATDGLEEEEVDHFGDHHGATTNNDTKNNRSLFSELDTQYSSLQESYGELLHRCSCSVGHALRQQQLRQPSEQQSNGSIEEDSADGLSRSTSSSVAAATTAAGDDGAGLSSEGKRDFKRLFDEMFATLRQTAQVADRLIEGKGGAV